MVKTTPKPRATKKSSGEPVGPPATPAVVAAGGMKEEVDDGFRVFVEADTGVIEAAGDVVKGWLPGARFL